MIKTLKQAKELAKEYNKIKKDKDRLSFLRDHKDTMKVVLDNDCTMVNFIWDDESMDDDIEDKMYDIDSSLESFDGYHGWTDSVVELFEFAGITAEQC